MKIVRAIAIALLGFLGITAIGGGCALIAEPTSHLTRMPLSGLAHSTLPSYVIPGIILFLANCVLGLSIRIVARQHQEESVKTTWKVAIWALGFLSISGLVGAIPLILDPDGVPWGYMHQSMLQYSPFHSYLIPGVVLFFAIGVLSLLIFVVTLKRRDGYGWWVAFQGCVLTGWMVVEVVMLRVLSWPQYLYLSVGLLLIVSGLALTRKPRTS
jgi:hypothetical protein